MRNLIIILLLFIVLVSSIFSKETKLEIITTDELFSDYFSNFKIKNHIELKGDCLGYSVAKKTGEILITTEEDNQYNIHFFDYIGNLLWKKEFVKNSTLGSLLKGTPTSISNNGSTIVIHKAINDRVENLIYDHSGNLLFKKSADSQFWFILIPTPDGEYFYEKQSAIECRIDGLYIYDKTGKEIELTGYDFNTEKWIRPVFTDDNKVIMYMEDKIAFFEFNAGNFDLISEIVLENMHSFRENFQEDILFNKNFVLVSNENSLMAQAFLFKNSGEFIRDFPAYDTATIINPNEILIRLNHTNQPNQQYLKHINISENRIINNVAIKFREYYDECIEINDFLLVSRTLWYAQENRISSFIFNIKSLTKIAALNELVISTDKNVIFLFFKDGNCSVLIGEVD